MNKVRSWGGVAVTLVVFALVISFAPNASADTLFIEVSAATSCGVATGCTGGNAYSLGDLLGQTATPESLPSFGTFLVDNDTLFSTLSESFSGASLPSNDALECEVTGNIDGSMTTCSIAGSLGTTQSGQIYGPGVSTGNITITFNSLPTCPVGNAANCMFDLTLADYTTTPEPSSLLLLAIGFAGLFGLAYWKSGALRLGFRT